jgi:hypothetical protein
MMVTVLGLAGLAIILFAISRAPSEPADHYRMLYPEFFEDQPPTNGENKHGV